LNGLAPNEINSHNSASIFYHQYSKYFIDAALSNYRVPVKYKVGDLVRVGVYKKIFQKASDETFSDELFYITKVIESYPITYSISDINANPVMGSFYYEELQRAQPNALFERRIEKIIPLKNNLHKIIFVGHNDIFNQIVTNEELKKYRISYE